MQVAVLHCAWLTRIHIEYLDVQDRQVISACTAAEGDVWSVLPLFCILSASGKSTNHSRPPLPVLWWASDQMFRYFGGELDWDARWQRWIPCWLQLMPLCQLAAGSDVVSPCQFLLTSTALHSDLKKLFYHTNRWLSALAGLACTSVPDAKGAINLVSGWCNTSTCIMYYIFNVMPLREAQLKKLRSLFGH